MDIYSINVTDMNGQETNLTAYKGQVLLIVNTATGCGYTPQYKGLQSLYDTYSKRGFSVLDFPSNQFRQAPGEIREINDFCTLNYGTKFPRFAKIEVNGKNESPLYTFLKKEQNGVLGSNIKWNFTKFLVDKNGNVVKRYAPGDTPEAIEKDIIALL